MEFNVLDLFAGCGGLAYGFENSNEFSVLLANDFWEEAKNTYIENYPDVEFFLEDISNLRKDKIRSIYPEGVDIIIGGPPCQGFSMCGTRDSYDERNNLFKSYARVVSETNPKLFLMENVKGLLSMENEEGKPIIDEIYKEFSKLGYSIKHKVLNSADYGVPQARERVIFVGTNENIEGEYYFPKRNMTEDKYVGVEEALHGLPNEDSPKGELEYTYERHSSYINFIRSEKKKIYNHKRARHSKEVVKRMSFVPQGGNWKNIPEEHRVGGIHSNAYRRLKADEPSITIKHAFKSMIIHPEFNRCLTVREIARLQSFPDDFIFKGSKTSQFQQLANAVPPLLSMELADSILEYFEKVGIEPKKEDVEVYA